MQLPSALSGLGSTVSKIPGFIWGDPAGMSYEEMLQQRQQAQMLQGSIGRPQNVGEGIGALAKGFAAALAKKKAGVAEEAGREEADEIFRRAAGGSIFGDLMVGRREGTPPFMPPTASSRGMSGPSDPLPPPERPMSQAAYPGSLVQNKSGGNLRAYNDEVGAGGVRGHGGRLQFGAARLEDAARAGVVPQMSPREFAAQPEQVQAAVENWHFSDIDRQADRLGLTRYIGQEVGGVPVTRDAIRSMAHLGGIGGAQKFLETGGRHNPADVNGTSLRDYGQRHGGGGSMSTRGGGMGAMDTQLLEAMSNPYMSEGQRSALGMLFQQRMQANDPMRAMQMEKAQLELEQMRNPGRPRRSRSTGSLVDPSTGQVVGDYRDPMAAPEPTDDIQEYEYAKSQGYQGSFDEFMLASRRAGATNVSVTNGSDSEVGTIPQGFESFTDPETGARSMRPIPGGPEDASQQAERAAGNASTAGDIITTAADRALDAAGARTFDGLAGRALSYDPSTRNAEVYRQVDVLKANATIEKLNAMRAASPTGGALGSVTEKEGAMLAAASGALDPASPNFRRDMLDYTRTMLRVIHGRDAGDQLFGEKYGEPEAPADPMAQLSAMTRNPSKQAEPQGEPVRPQSVAQEVWQRWSEDRRRSLAPIWDKMTPEDRAIFQ